MKQMCAVLILSASLIGATAIAQQTQSQQRIVFNVDVGRFRLSESQTYLELYYGIYSSLLTYRQTGESFFGGIRLCTRLSRQGDSVDVVNRCISIPVVHKGVNDPVFLQTIVGQYGYALEQGRYDLIVSVSDSLNPARKDSVVMVLDCLPMSPNPSLSDIELCSRIESSTRSSDLFFKNGLEVEPNPSLVFGAKSHPVVFTYLEIYSTVPESSYVLWSWISDISGKSQKIQRKNRQYKGTYNIEALTTNVTQLSSGKYVFHVVLAGKDSTVYAHATKTFFAHNPHVAGPLSSALSERAAEFAGMLEEELDDEFRKLQFFANDEEKKMYRILTGVDGKREFLASFWLSLERGRAEYPPITRAVYLQRVLDAIKRFGSTLQGSRPGWECDRGRVFLLYGEPDEVERVPSQTDKRPYETWHYYSIESGVNFIFVDRSGFGEMVLVNSTKRGELQDTQWQQYLR